MIIFFNHNIPVKIFHKISRLLFFLKQCCYFRVTSDYHPVVFRDIGADYSFLTRSTATSNQTVKWEDGNEYPLINIDISSKSHPFYTGQQRFGKARGRIEKFNRRYGKTAE